jgi:hypothetical protein
MPFNTEDPYNRLRTQKPVGRATEALDILRSDAPLEPLRSSQRPDSALDLPLWRPGGNNPPADSPSKPPSEVEQTAIGTVMAQIADSAHVNAFVAINNDVKNEYRQYGKDVADIYLAEQREMYAALRDLDVWAMNNGFTAAAARHVGTRLANRELTPEDALAEIVALG